MRELFKIIKYLIKLIYAIKIFNKNKINRLLYIDFFFYVAVKKNNFNIYLF